MVNDTEIIDEIDVTTTNPCKDDALREKAIEEFKQIKGVGQTVAEKLWDAQFFSVMDIGACPLGEFIEKTNMSKASAQKIIENARTIADIGKPQTLGEALANESKMRLTTGCTMLDELLGGGFTPGLITEVYGEPGNGKTQTCFTATVLATQDREVKEVDADGQEHSVSVWTGGHVMYVDTEGTFKPNRIKEIIDARGLDFDELKTKIHILQPRTVSEQILMMDEVKKQAQMYPFKLIVIDSLIGHFRAEYVGRGQLAERQQLLSKYLADLQTIAVNNGAVAIVVSQASANPDGFGYGLNFQSTGGNCVHHRTAYRLLVRKGAQGTRVYRLTKSPCQPDGEAIALIDERGVTDKTKKGA